MKKMKKKKKYKTEKRKKEKNKNKERSFEEKSRSEKRRHKVWKSETLKKKRKRIVYKSESEEEKPVKKRPKVEREELEEREFVEAQFRFFKVGKTAPAKEFVTLMRSPRHPTLDALKKELLATQIGGLDIMRKLPGYDISIYVKKGDKQFAANTA